MTQAALHTLYPVTASFLDAATLSNLETAHSKSAETLLTAVEQISREGLAPFFLPDIFAVERAMEKVASKTVVQPGPTESIIVNPTATILADKDVNKAVAIEAQPEVPEVFVLADETGQVRLFRRQGESSPPKMRSPRAENRSPEGFCLQPRHQLPPQGPALTG